MPVYEYACEQVRPRVRGRAAHHRGSAQDLPALPRAQAQAPDLADLVRAEGRRLVRGSLRVEVRPEAAAAADRPQADRTRPPRSPKPPSDSASAATAGGSDATPRSDPKPKTKREGKRGKSKGSEGRRVARLLYPAAQPMSHRPAPRSSSTVSALANELRAELASEVAGLRRRRPARAVPRRRAGGRRPGERLLHQGQAARLRARGHGLRRAPARRHG